MSGNDQTLGLSATQGGPFKVVPQENLPAGTQLGSFVIRELIGRGGWGSVYIASHVSDGRKAAVKVLHGFLAQQPLAAERFFREVQTLRRIKHPSMVEIYEVGVHTDNRPFFAMELLQGSNLRATLSAEGRMSVVEAFHIVEQLCQVLAAAHDAGVIHRDIKPENVLVGHDQRVVLLDFGLAKLIEPDPTMPGLTTTQQVLGTLVTMAPEQIRGMPVDQRTDIYGLGVLMYNMLTGSVPFRGEAEEIMRMHLECPPRPPSAVVNLPAAIDAVVLRCLEKDPSARFPSVMAFLEAFRAATFGSQAPTRARIGVGILVQIVAGTEADEDALTDAALALDEAEATMAGAGYQIPLRTSREVLGVLIAPLAEEQELSARRAAVELGQGLHGALTAMVPATVRVGVTINCGDVHVRDGTSDILGGTLLEVPDWSWNHDSVVVTARAGAGLERP